MYVKFVFTPKGVRKPGVYIYPLKHITWNWISRDEIGKANAQKLCGYEDIVDGAPHPYREIWATEPETDQARRILVDLRVCDVYILGADGQTIDTIKY